MLKYAKPILILTLAAAAITVGLVLPVGDWMDQFLDWLHGYGAWGPVLLGAAYIPATILFIPGSALTLGGGAIFGVFWGTVAVSLGSTAGSTMAFIIGRFFARDWVTQKVEQNPKFKAIDAAVAQNGFRIVLLTRLSPLFPYNLLGYMYGITSVRWHDYVLASWIGMFPGTVMYVYLGSLLQLTSKSERSRTPGEWALYILGGVATIGVTLFVTRIARRALAEAAIDETPSETPAPMPQG